MTRSEFLTECLNANVTPEIALENDLIVEALKSKNDALVIELLLNEF
jgi:hypothetical protein